MASASTAARGLGAHIRHRPEDTVLYDVVRTHLAPFLAVARERSGRPLPRYVEQTFRAYLDCGVLAKGFLRAFCAGCGTDLLVAFSCKRRGVCPSCEGRRMADAAAQLVDGVLPDVPVRHQVLSLPFALRLLLAARAEVLSAVIRIFLGEVTRAYATAAARLGLAAPRGGALCATQRFGGSLNLNVHLHAIFLDGVYTADVADAPPRFHTVPAPTTAALEAAAARVAARVTRLLRRRGLHIETAAEDRSNATEVPDALTACLQLGAQPGRFATLAPAGEPAAAFERPRGRGHGPWTAEVAGFNVHAGVTVATGDRAGRERLCRYVLRPPFGAERFTRLPDGRIVYRLARPGPHGHRHRVLEPLELMARLAALIPPPRVPLLRYHGVLAPHAAARRAVVPATPRVATCASDHAARSSRRPTHETPPGPERRRVGPGGACIAAGTPAAPDAASDAHPARRARGVRRAAAGGGQRIDWATLLHRTFAYDPRACPRCGGRLAWIATVTAPAAIARILTHLGKATGRPVPTRAWDPVGLDASHA